MVTLTTAGLKISVQAYFQDEYSDRTDSYYLFAYRIQIYNGTERTVQLLHRKWDIFDSNCERRRVEGDGVVGVQPVLEPGEHYTYSSGCNLKSEIGYMQGEYDFITLDDGMHFKVEIPRFILMADYRLN